MHFGDDNFMLWNLVILPTSPPMLPAHGNINIGIDMDQRYMSVREAGSIPASRSQSPIETSNIQMRGAPKARQSARRHLQWGGIEALGTAEPIFGQQRIALASELKNVRAGHP